ncbi:MAG: ParA family protein [Candidatus Krumholzibacteriota bacterium]|nr:ParA family protein [Candidatus Krumholzibacteriota bacterium]
MHRTETAAFLNQKGGVGKTTSVVNTGAGLAILGKRVLIVDLDPQGHLTSFLGIESKEIDKTVADFMRGYIDPRQAIISRPLKARFCIDGEESPLSISVIPSSPGLVELESFLFSSPDRESFLRKAIAKIEYDFDYILFDCSPSLGLVTMNALNAANKVFIPVQTEYLALRSLEQLIRRIEKVMVELNNELVIGGLIATRFDGRKVLSRNVLESLREHYGALLLNTIIRENIVLAESPRFGKDIFSFRPRSNGAQDYLNLALEIMGRVAAAENLFSVERGVITGNRDYRGIAESGRMLENYESLR